MWTVANYPRVFASGEVCNFRHVLWLRWLSYPTGYRAICLSLYNKMCFQLQPKPILGSMLGKKMRHCNWTYLCFWTVQVYKVILDEREKEEKSAFLCWCFWMEMQVCCSGPCHLLLIDSMKLIFTKPCEFNSFSQRRGIQFLRPTSWG